MMKYFEVHLLNSLRVRSKIIRVLITTCIYVVLFIAATLSVLWVTLTPMSFMLGAEEGIILFLVLGLFLGPALGLVILVVAVVALFRFASSVQDISPQDVRLSREGKYLIAAFLVATALFIVLRHGQSILTAVVVNAADLLHIPALCSLEERHTTDCVRGAVPNGKTEYDYCHLVHPNDERHCKLQGAVATGDPQSCDQFSSDIYSSYEKCISNFIGAPEHVAYCGNLEEQVHRNSKHLKAMLMAQCAFEDPNVTAPYGVTPLMLAFMQQPYERPSSEYIRSLLVSGADPNVRYEDGGTPLLRAVRNKAPVDTLAVLLEYGADPNVTDVEGRIPLHIVAQRTTFAADGVELLLQHGADVHVRNVKGDTALMIALKVDEPSVRVIRALLEHGADANVRNNAGETPLSLAARKIAATHIMELLQEYGATTQYRN